MALRDRHVQKPKLDRTLLEDHGVFFVEGVYHRDNLPRWIQPIRVQLTRLRKRLPKDSRSKFSEELEIFRTSGQDSKEAFQDAWSLCPPKTNKKLVDNEKRFGKDTNIEEMENELDKCENVKIQVNLMRDRKELETSWVDLLQTHFFRTFDDVYSMNSLYEDTFCRWELHRDLHWNEFPQWENTNPEIKKRTGPKPDFTYAFPIIDTTTKMTAEHFLDSYVENFSLPVLKGLRNDTGRSLKSAPTTGLQRWTSKKSSDLGAADLICFPWAIVEVKTSKRGTKSRAKFDSSTEMFCYCQAANASAAALTMREKLASQYSDPSQEALVIFAITCVGPTVKLWITYRSSEKAITMQCIWATSLQLTWGVLALRMVVKNMREWVYERVKPEISKWIRNIRGCPLPQVFLTPGGDTVNRTRRAVSCEAPNRTLDFTSSGSPRRVVHPSKAAPALLRGKTAPEQVTGKKLKYRRPSIEPKLYKSKIVQSIEDAEDSEESEDEDGSDEGYASNATYQPSSEGEDEVEDDEDSASELESGAEEDDDDDLEVSEVWYPTPSKTDPKGYRKIQVHSASEDSDSDLDVSEDEEDEDEDESEGEEYIIDGQRYSAYQQVSPTPRRKVVIIAGSGKKNKPNKDRSPRPGIRRRSSHF
ncbi:Nn.00g045320.m01.CDS01 [Neocucurbitaria sp. VM-36]